MPPMQAAVRAPSNEHAGPWDNEYKSARVLQYEHIGEFVSQCGIELCGTHLYPFQRT